MHTIMYCQTQRMVQYICSTSWRLAVQCISSILYTGYVYSILRQIIQVAVENILIFSEVDAREHLCLNKEGSISYKTGIV